jgi:hypothetical protein
MHSFVGFIDSRPNSLSFQTIPNFGVLLKTKEPFRRTMQSPNTASSAPVGPTTAPTTIDPIAEMEDKRNRKEQRARQLENLKATRTSKRMNVYLSLGILTLLFGFSFFPVSQGDISSNPHDTLSAEEVTAWMNPSSPQHWTEEVKEERAETKIWDGSDTNAGTFEQDLSLGIWQPFNFGPLNDVQVKVTLKGYRFDGKNTSFRLGLFESPNGCAMLATPTNIMWADESLAIVNVMDSDTSPALAKGGIFDVTFTVKPGRYCLIFQYIDAQDFNHESWSSTDMRWKATIDSEVDMFWPRAFLLPLCVLILPFFIGSVIGAQKAGKAYKKVRYPEASSKTTEEQVMDATEAERAMGMDLSTGSEGMDEEENNLEFESEDEGMITDDDSSTSATEYTDEQLIAAGWTPEQIQQMRGN